VPIRAGRASIAAVADPDQFQQLAPHRLAEALRAEAERVSGVPVALYLVGLDGTCLVRLAGAEPFPTRLSVPRGLGPEIAAERYLEVNRGLQARLPGCVAAPMRVYGRAVGLLLALRSPAAPLDALADQAASAMELASGYTDVFAAARRTERISVAAEIQQNLLPPRIAHLEGAELAATIIPTYEVGGDWFDYAQNADGVWVAVADGVGKGARAGALATIALAALRAARRNGDQLERAARAVHEAVMQVSTGADFVTAILAHWDPQTMALRWLTFGHPRPLVVHLNGAVEELSEAVNAPLGLWLLSPLLASGNRRLRPGERLILYSDGVSERRSAAGRLLGVEGIRAVVARAGVSAVATVSALADAVDTASPEPVRDDATILVLRPTGR